MEQSDPAILTPQLKYFLIGATHTGTTSLHYYLTQHPEISGEPKETYCFDRGRHGPVGNLDATATYFRNPKVPPKIKQYNPNAKIIAMLRNPTPRLWSAYWFGIPGKKNADIFDTYVSDMLNNEHVDGWWYWQLKQGLYDTLEVWQLFFPDMLIIRSEDFFANPKKIFIKTQEFLGVKPITLPNYQKLNAAAKGTMNYDTKIKLNDYYNNRWNEIWSKTKKLYI